MKRVTLILLGCLLAACQRQEADPVPIRLGAGVAVDIVESRATPDMDLLSPTFASGDQVSIYFESASEYYNSTPYTFTAGTASGIWAPLTTSPNLMYPKIGTVDIFAFHPVLTGSRSASSPFSVQADQSTRANYVASDLMWAEKTGQVSTTSMVQLTFQHLLSKLTLRLVQGNGIASGDLDGSTLTIGGSLILNGTFTPASHTFTPASSTVTTVTFASSANLVCYADQTSAHTGGGTDYSVILPPQSIPADAVISITTGAGEVISGTLGTALTLTAAHEAVLVLDVGRSTLTIKCVSLDDWASGGTGSVTF